MLKVNVQNERVKRQFFRYMREAQGCAQSTVIAHERAILLYQRFSKNGDLRSFNPERAIEFKKWLLEGGHGGKKPSLATYNNYLRFLRAFFIWLCQQPGFKKKISRNSVDFLNITDKEQRIATQYVPRKFPTLEHVIKLVESIPANREVDMRDRALIAFALLTGMRDAALASLPLKCFDERNLVVYQNPNQGVQTKFSKFITSKVFKFHDALLKPVLEWYEYLTKAKGFSPENPFFPRSRSCQGKDNLSFEESNDVEPVFWRNAGRVRRIFKDRAKAADLPYYPPHTFRHAAFWIALKACTGGDQIKAVSQNFGHNYVATTFSCYGNLEPQAMLEVLNHIRCESSPNGSQAELTILKLVKALESQGISLKDE